MDDGAGCALWLAVMVIRVGFILLATTGVI